MTDISSIAGRQAVGSLSFEPVTSPPDGIELCCVCLVANDRLGNASIKRQFLKGRKPSRTSHLKQTRPSSPNAIEDLTLGAKTSGRESTKWARCRGRGLSLQSRAPVGCRCLSNGERSTRRTRRASPPQLHRSHLSVTSSSPSTSRPLKNSFRRECEQGKNRVSGKMRRSPRHSRTSCQVPSR